MLAAWNVDRFAGAASEHGTEGGAVGNLTAILPYRRGALAEACEALARAGINIDICCELEGYFYVLAEDVAAARRALEDCSCDGGRERYVLSVDVEDRSYATEEVVRRIADQVDVNFIHLMTSGPRLVVGAGDVERARAAIGGLT